MIGKTILTVLVMGILQWFIEMLLGGAVWMANQIMDSSITMFDGSNIFERFTSLLPFENTTNVLAIIKAISYGILVVLFVTSVIKSVIAQATGEKAENPIQVAVRVVITIIIINLLFGFDFVGDDNMKFNGLLGNLGKIFGTILQSISTEAKAVDFDLVWPGLNVANYIGVIILLVTLLTSILGAALTYVERVLSFAVYIILGPIAISMYANKSTEQTAKEWLLTVFTQFLAIFISLLMWQTFIIQLNKAFNSEDFLNGTSLFELAIALVILTLVRNSEKIINAMGLRTMANGETARALTGGLAAIGSAMMMGMRAAPLIKGKPGGPGKPIGGGPSIYDANGNISSNMFKNADGKFTKDSMLGGIKKAFNSNTPKQMEAIKSLNDANGNRLPSVGANKINDAFNWNRNSTVNALGNTTGEFKGQKEGQFKYRTTQSTTGNQVQGYMGDVSYSHGGQKQTMHDAFIVTDGANETLAPGTSLGLDCNGEERFTDPNSSGPIIDDEGYQIYRTVGKTELDSGDGPFNTDPPSNENVDISENQPKSDEEYRGIDDFEEQPSDIPDGDTEDEQ